MPAAKQALVFVRITINPNIDQPKGYSFLNVRKKAYVITVAILWLFLYQHDDT